METLFKQDFFTGNRQRLYACLGTGVLVLAANGCMQATADAAYPFIQEPNFWYLTGIEEAEWRLIVDLTHKKEYLVAPRRLAYQDVFDGSLSHDGATKISGIATVLSQAAGRELLEQLLATKGVIHTLKPYRRKRFGFYTNRSSYDLHRSFGGRPVEDIRLTLARQRALKQPSEIAAIRQAIAITSAGIETLAEQLPKLHYEYEAEALIQYEFRRRGASGQAFDPIVAGGAHACTLHYAANNDRLVEGSLLVLDVGARYGNYPADITRTFALGTTSKRQHAVYDAILRIHDAAIELCRSGQSLEEYTKTTERLLSNELVKLGLIRNAADRKGLYAYMPHAISHGLGIEVHDSLGHPEVLQSGMVLTVEPGIYIPEEGIGVRIEDDILVTETGPEVLSAALPPDIGRDW